MKAPINDLIPRNIGKNGLIFDPSIDWFTGSLYATGVAGGTCGTVKLIDYMGEE